MTKATGRSRTTSPTASRGRPLRLLVALVLGALLWAGCSVEKHYRVLSFFFDGVPDPSELGPSTRRPGAGGAASGVAVVVSAHPDYAERRCQACHGGDAQFGFFVSGFDKLDATVCLRCHGEVLDEHPRLHGPVAAGACLWCHDPHESPQPHLLTVASPELCLDCHRFHLASIPPTPAHEDLGRDCLDCHRGHGGRDPYFLRSADRPPPDPAPAQEPG